MANQRDRSVWKTILSYPEHPAASETSEAGNVRHYPRSTRRRDILALRQAGIPMADAELVLARQLVRLDDLIGERNRLMSARPGPTEGKVLGGRKW